MEMFPVVRQFHDDWLLWNVHADGSVREFNTEIWWEHGRAGYEDWPAVCKASLSKAGRLLRFRLDNPEIDAAEFFRRFNGWFAALLDSGSLATDGEIYQAEQPE